MLMKNGTTTVKFHAYKLDPKSRFDAGTVKVDGKEQSVKVTTAKHAKFPPYTYIRQDGQLFYAKGDLRGAALETIKEEKAATPSPAPTPPAPSKKK